VVVAVVALKDGAMVDLEELREFATERLARYKLPRRLEIVPALPRNPAGKLLKFETARTVWCGQPSVMLSLVMASLCDQPFRPSGRGSLDTDQSRSKRDRGFESFSLQRRVRCEPHLYGQCSGRLLSWVCLPRLSYGGKGRSKPVLFPYSRPRPLI
jgi:hypothetical protein